MNMWISFNEYVDIIHVSVIVKKLALDLKVSISLNTRATRIPLCNYKK